MDVDKNGDFITYHDSAKNILNVKNIIKNGN